MVALTGNFHVVTSSGTTNISAVLFFISHITQARYVRTFFELRAGHTMLRFPLPQIGFSELRYPKFARASKLPLLSFFMNAPCLPLPSGALVAGTD
jgi:hypothetical protein